MSELQGATKILGQWKRAEFKVHINPRHPGTDTGLRSGYTCGPFGIHSQSQTWTITHLPSGLRVYEGATKLREAKEIAVSLLPLLDWGQTDPLQGISEETRTGIHKILLGAQRK